MNPNRLALRVLSVLGLWPLALVGASARGAPADGKPDVLAELSTYLEIAPSERSPIPAAGWATRALSRSEATRAAQLLWTDLAKRLREERKTEVEAQQVTLGELTMRYHTVKFGDKPANGRSLFISMHGGGGATAEVNDRQWENQKRLYEPEEGVYLAPRAPTNTWDLWHQGHIDAFFDRIITNMVLFEGVDPNRVYLMGYSAGGDGVFQLAPRMADRFAAAAMMAGHPNETSPLGLRNLPFTLHMGGKDVAYKRNEVAAAWKRELARLAELDPGGYPHSVEIHEDKAHWMDHEDRVAVPWMAQHRRNRAPSRIVWVQDDVTHERFYWLAVPTGSAKARSQVTATRVGQTITVETEAVGDLIVRLHDDWIDLDREVEIRHGDRVCFQGKVRRQVTTIARTLAERHDPTAHFMAEIEIHLVP